jgi:hypothetical protein
VIRATIAPVNTGANSTAEAIELTQAAKVLGANAVLLVTPYYNKPTQEGLMPIILLIVDRRIAVSGNKSTAVLPGTLYKIWSISTAPKS